MSQVTRDQIITEAKKYLGVPYKHAGRNEFGMDCVGPIIKVGHNLKLFSYDTINYPKRPSGTDFIQKMGQHMQRIQVAEATHGDVIVCSEPRHPCHCGFLEISPSGQKYMIHAYAPARKVIREPITPFREARMMLAFRYPGVVD